MFLVRSLLLVAIALLLPIESKLDSSCFPLLKQPMVGVVYNPPANVTFRNRTDALYQTDILGKGAKLIQMGFTWVDFEPTPNQFQYEKLADILLEARKAGLVPMFNLAAIDTNRVSVPPDLADPNNRFALAPGLKWTDEVVVSRYVAVLLTVAPLVAYSGAFYFGVGNEIDATLRQPGVANTTVPFEFMEFVDEVCRYVKYITTPDMACGATLTAGGLRSMMKDEKSTAPPAWLPILFNITDATPLTYYPLEGPMCDVLSPSAALAELSEAIALLPQGKCLLLQELGCPSGFNNASSVDHSSYSVQADFFNLTLSYLVSDTLERAVSAVGVFNLVDWGPALCLQVAAYYGISNPGFIEYLCTLGIVSYNGTEKLALPTVASFFQYFRDSGYTHHFD